MDKTQTPEVLAPMKVMLEEALDEISALEKRYTKAGGRRLRKKLNEICKEKVQFNKALLEFEK